MELQLVVEAGLFICSITISFLSFLTGKFLLFFHIAYVVLSEAIEIEFASENNLISR